MPDISLHSIFEANDYARLLHGAACPALQQGPAWGAVARLSGREVQRMVAREAGRDVALMQIGVRCIGPLRIGLLLRGPVWLVPARHETRRAMFQALLQNWSKWQGRFLFIAPEDSADNLALQPLGYRPVMTGWSTVMIDLSPDEDVLRAQLRQKWRNALNQAESAGVAVEIAHGGARLERLLLEEGAKQARTGYLAPAPHMMRALAMATAAASREDVLVVSVLQKGRPVSGQLFLCHGRAATYYSGWADEAGRKVNAHNLGLWRAMLALKARGIATLDLGGVDTGPGAGIARFKLGTGGAVKTLPGTYI